MKRMGFTGWVCFGVVFSFLGLSAYASTNGVAALPFSEGFETGSLASCWTVSGTGGYRTQVATAYVPASGSHHLTMDSSGSFARNELTLCVDLDNRENVVLDFWAKEFGDEAHGPPPSPFVGGADFDGVAISADGTNWYEVAELRTLGSIYVQRTVDLDAAVATHGLSYNSTFWIRFNQYDNYPLSTDGIAIDDISITGNIADELKIVPSSNLSVFGYEGGPFAPTNQIYTLVNIGTSNLTWTASAAESWVVVSPTNGVLAAGETNQVAVSIDSSINAFPPGTNTDTVVFSNMVSGKQQSRGVQLEIRERMLDHFVWEPVGTAQRATAAFEVEVVAVDQAGVCFPGFTNTVSLSGLQGEAISPLQSGAFSAGVWTGSVAVLDAATNMVLRADDGASHTGDSNPFNVDPLMLSVWVPESASEGDGVVTGEVTANVAPLSNLVVTLVSDDLSEATVVASVVILAGQTNVLFDVTILDDSILDGSQRATLTASTSNYLSGASVIDIHDNELATLSLSLPQTTFEGAGTIAGMVTVSSAPDEDVVVELVSNNPEKVASGSVVIPAGQGFASFTLLVVDNNLIDGMQTATVSAQVQNWTGGQASVFVFDNETSGINVQILSSAMEGDGVLTNAGTVSLSGVATADIHAVLTSSDATEVVVPAYVTISNGQSSASFDITIMDDAETDGMQTLSILAQATGFVPGSDTIEVQDNDLYTLAIDGLSTNQPVLEPIAVNITAMNIDGMPMTWFTGSVALAASGDTGAVALSPTSTTNFIAGAWTGDVAFSNIANNVVLTVDDGAGYVGTSTVFNVTGSQIIITPDSLTNTLVVAGETFTRTMVISNTGNADLEFTIRGGGADQSLILHYTFDDDAGNTAIDQSGNGNDGAIMNRHDYTEGVYGKGLRIHGNSESYSSSGGHVMLPTLDYNSMSEITIAFWVKEEVMHHDAGEAYIQIGSTPLANGRINIFNINRTDVKYSIGTTGAPFISTAPTSGEFVHYSMTYSGGTMHAYRNGELVGKEDAVLKVDLPQYAALGRQWWSGGASTSTRLTAVYDDVRIYKRALSASEIAGLYAEDGDAGLVAHFPFNGNANDESGNGHDGTVNGATLAMDRFGNASSAYLFDGDDFIEVTDAPELRLSGTSFSIGTWLKETTRNTSYQSALITKRGGGNANGWFHSISGNQSSVGSGKSFYQVSGGLNPSAYTSVQIPLDTWVYSMVTYDLASQTLRFYINGVLDSEHANIPPPNSVTDANLFIGIDSATQLYGIHGVIDDIRIYDRALPEVEIQELYAATSSATSAKNSNLIPNGDFEDGNTRFTSTYTYHNTPASGRYFVGEDSRSWNGYFPTTLKDHTSGSGLMLMADGNSLATEVWEQTVDVIAGVDYEFSAWVAGLEPRALPVLEFKVDGLVVGTVATEDVTWKPFFGSWTSMSSGTITLSIRSVGTEGTGNDFAIDDIVFSATETEGGDGLVAAYPFNGNANDESGNGHDGTVNGATLTTDRFGNVDSAYDFDGVDDYVDIGNSLGTEDTSFTVSTWMCSTNARFQALVAKKTPGLWEAGEWMLYVFSQQAHFVFSDRHGDFNEPATANINLHDGDWHHVCGVMGSNGTELYIDGVFVAESTSVAQVAQDDSTILIGARNDVGSRLYFDGKLDDVRIYNRALSAAEITSLYNAEEETEESWLSVDTKFGTIPPGSNAVISVRFNAAGLVAGDYAEDLLKVTSNDPFVSSNAVPASMWVLPPAPTMAVEPEFTVGTSNQVAWSVVDGPVEYLTEVVADTNTVALLQSGWVSVTNHTFGSLTTNVVYYYHVKASVSSGIGLLEGSWSDWVQSKQVVGLDDLDSDLIADWWEQLYFGGSTNCDPLADADGDGQNNRAEFITGMDPTDPDSLFMVRTFDSPTNGQFVVSWDSVTGRVYSVDWNGNLPDGFQSLETDIHYPQNSYTDSVHNAESQGFYRIGVELE